MCTKEQTIDRLLGILSPEEKAGQFLVLGWSGTFVDPELEDFVDKYNIGGIRTSPYFRKFIRYLPPGSPGISNVVRPLSLREKMWAEGVHAQHLRASEYAGILNRLRSRAMERKHSIPLHFVIDYESGASSNFLPPGLIALPDPMGMERTGDIDLIYRSWKVVGKQLKGIGFDQVHAPVVDVNTNPRNPEISTRSFSADEGAVIKCARAALRGLHEAGIIATLKHYPGRGDAEADAHYGVSSINLDRKTMDRVHLAPYKILCREKNVPAVMPAHSIYPSLDSTLEIATVSKPILTDILRKEIGFDGLIVTDSMTMGGLMARYSVAEAAIKAIEAGADIVLLKDENKLRYETYDAIVEAIKTGRLREQRVAESLRRIWSVKWDYGLFENGGVVETEGLDEYLFKEDFQETGAEAASKAIHILRDRKKILPLSPQQKIMVIDRITSIHLWQNDSWTYPGMFWKFMLEHSRNVSYVDYLPATIDKATAIIEQMVSQVDVLVVSAEFHRGQKQDTKPFIRDLKRFGKPIVLVTNNPYDLIVPDEIDTVVVSYSLMHESMKAVSDFLFTGNQ